MLPAVMLVAVAGCVPSPHSCTMMGARSGVSFDVSALWSGDGTVTAEACVRQRCDPVHLDASRAGDWQFVADDGIHDTGPVEVRFTVTDARTGKVRSAGTAMVPLKVFQPNGPDCAPTVYAGKVRVAADGQLTPVR